MSETIATLQRGSSDQVSELYEQISELSADKEALLTELTSMCEQLAQKQIVHTAQERQLLNSLTSKQYDLNHKEKTCIEAATKHKMLTEQYDKLNQENIRLHMDRKELQEKFLESEKKEQECKLLLATLQAEHNLLMTNYTHLQSVVEAYQATDGFSDVSVIAEYERFKKDQTRKDEEFKLQMSKIQTQLADEVRYREEVVQELSHCKMELRDKVDLLQQVQQTYMSEGSYYASAPMVLSSSSNVNASTQPHPAPSHLEPHVGQVERQPLTQSALLDESMLTEGAASHASDTHVQQADQSHTVRSDTASVQSDFQSDRVSWLFPNESEKKLRTEIKRLKIFCEKVMRQNAELREEQEKKLGLEDGIDNQMLSALKESLQTLTSDRERLLEQIAGYQSEIVQLQDLLQTTMQTQSESVANEQKLVALTETIKSLQDERTSMNAQLDEVKAEKDSQMLLFEQRKVESDYLIMSQTHTIAELEQKLLQQNAESDNLITIQKSTINDLELQLLHQKQVLAEVAAAKEVMVSGYIAENQQLEEQIAMLTEELASGQREMVALQVKFDIYSQQIEIKTKRIAELETLVKDTVEKIDTIDEMLIDYRQQLAESTETVDKLKGELIKEHDKVHILEEEKLQYIDMVSALEEEKGMLQASLENVTREHAILTQWKSEQEGQARVYSNTTAELVEANRLLSDSIVPLAAKVSTLEEYKSKVDKDTESLIDKQREQLKKIEDCQSSLESLELEKRLLQESKTELSDVVKDLLAQVKVLEENINITNFAHVRALEENRNTICRLVLHGEQLEHKLHGYKRLSANYYAELQQLDKCRHSNVLVPKELLKRSKRELSDMQTELKRKGEEYQSQLSYLQEVSGMLKEYQQKHHTKSKELVEREKELAKLQTNYQDLKGVLEDTEKKLGLLQSKYEAERHIYSLDKEEYTKLHEMIVRLRNDIEAEKKCTDSLVKLHDEEKRQMEGKHTEEMSTLKSSLRKAFKRELQYKDKEKESVVEKYVKELKGLQQLLDQQSVLICKGDDELSGKYKSLQSRYDMLQSNYISSQDQYRVLVETYDKALKDHRASQLHTVKLQQQLEALELEYGDGKSKCAQVEDQMNQLIGQLQRLESDSASSKQASVDAQQHNTKLLERVHHLEEKCTTLRMECEAAKAQCLTLQGEVKELQREEQVARGQCADLEGKCAVLQVQWEVARGEVESKDRDVYTLKEQLKGMEGRYRELLRANERMVEGTLGVVVGGRVMREARVQDCQTETDNIIRVDC
ncbi:hypothetical protein EON65_21625, partial [archaeon]